MRRNMPPIENSKLEQRALKWLKARYSFNFKRGVSIGGYKFDFVDVKRRVAVEVNGCWHHACETCRKKHGWGALMLPQKRSRLNDRRKAEAAVLAGYDVLTLWEHALPRQ